MNIDNQSFTNSSIVSDIISWIIWCSFQEYFILIFQKLFYQARKHFTGINEPLPHSTVFLKDKHKISFFLTLFYFIYKIHGIYRNFSENFYEILKVSPYDSKRKLKSQFRKIVLKVHPDKIVSGNKTEFIELQLIYHVLLNARQRFAYERFGPSSIEWSDGVSMFETLFKSIKSSIHFYGGIILIFLVSNLFKIKPYKKFWHFYGLGVCFTLEILSLVRSNPTFPFNYLFPRKLPFEFLDATHTFIRIFLLSWPNIEIILFKRKEVPDILTSSKKINHLSTLLLNESTDLLNMEYSCYANKSIVKDRIKEKIKEVLFKEKMLYNENVLKKS
ncbi:uncharacterized protein T551_00868 [Pneumocystis jirovecii RU7]|uniref:J domain-containing protein n=1 Tax=Pneumocystis jirovecii (strain RU7) TaxID=1408657 RepID=A0A0W4ZUY3_PNEJ7|nr:uncharacterized protein T551_00868 [Pneumocystis jirovecii RU7]KTW32186.1 hypothetical protein T551_00868 [Pneumocystis jirovecii RU7]